MKDKVVLVTGGGTGIGKAIAKCFVDLGAFVVITGRREAKLTKTAEELGKNVSYIVGDVSKLGVAKSTIQELIEKHRRLDVLVNNAGVAKHGKIVDVSDEDIEILCRTNLFAPFALIREAMALIPRAE